ncbi:MAG TPA: acetyltransferase [Thermoanaerobaculia bacterium]|nr:acetyltransferase [Thermoanaerobaculia bacterium]
MSARRAAVLGAGGHAKVVIATLEAAGWEVVGVFDDAEDRWGGEILGLRVRGPLGAARETAIDGAVIAVGDNRAREDVAGRIDLPWVAVAHPAAAVHPSAALGPGTVVFAGAVIQPDTIVGRHAIVNTAASVDHDCRLGDFVHVAPGARLAGNITVGDGALVGIGSSVMPGVRIGAWASIGAGAAVVREVERGSTVVGVPARPR